jgi:hypothetical protein
VETSPFIALEEPENLEEPEPELELKLSPSVVHTQPW